MSKIHHGSCLCKSVKYTTNGDPFTFHVCHCGNCGKATGSAFAANIFFTPEQVEITDGKEIMKAYRDYDTKSGVPVLRWFCSQCGSSVFLSNDDNKFMIVSAGTFDEKPDWMPKKIGFVEDMRHWVDGIKVASKRSRL